MSPYWEAPSGGRSLGTIRPPAVTRRPGGLPCSLSNRSALPRLNEGDGEGFLRGPGCAIPAATEGRRLRLDARPARVADADADGRNTCSTKRLCQQPCCVAGALENSKNKLGDRARDRIQLIIAK